MNVGGTTPVTEGGQGILDDMGTKKAPRGATAEPTPGQDRRQNRRTPVTRDRILSAGTELVRGATTWEWTELTFRAVAERAGVSERTVYRHFPNERELHAAIGRRLEEELGVQCDDVSLAELPELKKRVYAMLSTFAVSSPVDAPPRWSNHEQWVKGLREAVRSACPDGLERDLELAAAVVDVVWSGPSYERLIRWSELEPEEATRALEWVHGLVVEAIENGRLPRKPKRGASRRRAV